VAKLPYIPFFVNDWIADTQMLSIGARGLWLEMLLRMWQAPSKGYFVNASGVPFSLQQTAKMIGANIEQTEELLSELRDNGICSQDADGVYFNRRMARESRLSQVRSEAGKSGAKAKQTAQASSQQSESNALVRARSRDIPEPYSRSQKLDSKAAAAVVASFPRFAAAARSIFPTTDDLLVAELVVLSQAEYSEISDSDLERLILYGVQKRDQRSQALWRNTLPEAVRSWRVRMEAAG